MSGTAKKWIQALDPHGQWLEFYHDDGVTTAKCRVCREKESHIKMVRNFSDTLITGISGSKLKKDTLKKHSESKQHLQALQLAKTGTVTRLKIYETPIGKFSNSEYQML